MDGGRKVDVSLGGLFGESCCLVGTVEKSEEKEEQKRGER